MVTPAIVQGQCLASDVMSSSILFQSLTGSLSVVSTSLLSVLSLLLLPCPQTKCDPRKELSTV